VTEISWSASPATASRGAAGCQPVSGCRSNRDTQFPSVADLHEEFNRCLRLAIQRPAGGSHRLLFGRLDLELLAKRSIEIEYVVEVLAAILAGLSHPSDANQVEYDLAEVAGRVDAPAIEDRLGHVTVLVDGELADRSAEFLPGDVPFGSAFILRLFDARHRLAFGRLPQSQRLLGVAQRFEQEDVGFKAVSLVLPQQFDNRVEHHQGEGSSGAGEETAGFTGDWPGVGPGSVAAGETLPISTSIRR